MAVVVVGGGARGVGKTALVCGVIAALKEFGWAAVKVTTHAHAGLARIYEENAEENAAGEETAAEQRSDTARFLAAGARRAFLLSALDSELGERLREVEGLVGPEANVIFESNCVLRHLRADVCLAIEPEAGLERKASFALVEREKQATVRRVGAGTDDQIIDGAQPVFALAELERVSEPMQAWLRERLRSTALGEQRAR